MSSCKLPVGVVNRLWATQSWIGDSVFDRAKTVTSAIVHDNSGIRASSYEITTGRSFPEGKSDGCLSIRAVHSALFRTSSRRRVYISVPSLLLFIIIIIYCYFVINMVLLCATGMANDHTGRARLIMCILQPNSVVTVYVQVISLNQTVSSEYTNGDK
jgi:hypothetical protein